MAVTDIVPGSWGGVSPFRASEVVDVSMTIDAKGLPGDLQINFAHAPFLPYGLGRSYGDVCLNEGGTLLRTSLLDSIQHIDTDQGIITVHSGVTLETVLQHVIPLGWTLPVVPGTRFVTIGGAIANDIHGKNHHNSGCFGNHVESMIIWHKGTLVECSASTNQGLFRATIGGIGLTGLIVSACIRLQKISSSTLTITTSKVGSLATMLQELKQADRDYEFTVGWFDVQRQRGHLQRANRLHDGNLVVPRLRALSVPSIMHHLLRDSLVNLGNAWYYHRVMGMSQTSVSNYTNFFFPLDALTNWNVMYKPLGLLQYQFVVPDDHALSAISKIFSILKQASVLVNLAVIKTFGSTEPVGILSFARPGVTVALDMKNTHHAVHALSLCDDVVSHSGGRVYLAKDARLSPESFHDMYGSDTPEFLKYRDLSFSSSLWRRVTGETS